MIPLFDAVGTAVWRASWQAAALALLVFVLARCCGERLAPRWRYLLWSLVVVRLLLVATPSCPWSLFNYVGWNPEPEARQVTTRAGHQQETRDGRPVASTSTRMPTRQPTESAPNFATEAEPKAIAVHSGDPTNSPPVLVAAAARPVADVGGRSFVSYVVRILPGLWLAGCFLFGMNLLASAFVLHRRIAACRPLTDAAVLNLLESARVQFGLKRAPALLVTPEAISPCLIGTWNPRIVLPETIVTDSPHQALAHVLSHELAHLVRGDLWTNWLLLAIRILHWFNPVAWWTIREMQAEREAACDELALAALGQVDRRAYAATVVDLAARLVPSAIAPGMIGLFSSAGLLHGRVNRLLRFRSVKTFRSPFAAGLLAVIAVVGLTDAMPTATADQPPAKGAPAPAKAAPVAAKGQELRAQRRALSGQCIDHVDKSPLAGIPVRIFKAQGRTSPIVEQAKTITDRDGNFEFADLIPPRPDDPVDQLIYLIFAEMDNRPIGMGGTWTLHERDPNHCNIRILRDQTKLTGRILDPRGQPVKGATVAGLWDIDGRPVPGILSATTDAEGRFEIDRIPDFKKAFGRPSETTFTISHPEYPRTRLSVAELPGNVTVSLREGCRVTGTVTDKVTGKPAVGAVVLAQNADDHSEAPAVTNAVGRFELALAEGRYAFLANAPDRICVALTDRECLAGEKVELPPFQLIAGGFISGRVLISATDEPRTVTEQGEPIALGLYGPSHPKGKVISPVRMAKVDDTGRFTLRAAPGDNFPYFVNFQGDRMAWDTANQRPVVVKEGETTDYDMLITPKIPPAEKLKAARLLVESLPKEPLERTAQIILEFRNLEHTVDETETWCTLMRALVGVGADAVPQLCAELDATNENRTLRRLAFALRAIGDPRAVPALIRAIPKTLLPSSSDFGLIVEDKDLTAFMQKHDLDEGEGGTYFGLGRPEREIQGALLKLTRRNSNEVTPFGLSRSEDPRRQVLQRRILQRRAQEWQTWWEAHGRELTSDPAYQKVNLEIVDEPLTSAATKLGPDARMGNEGWTGAVLSPAVEKGRYAWFFYDLDTGDQPRWPAQIPKDEAKIDQQKLADWAAESGVDLMCVTHRAPDGKETYVLRTFGVKAWEIGPRDLRNIDKLIAAGKLPEGRDVGELLMHYDAESERLVPDANGAFIFVTREGSMGLIEVTDRVVRTQNLNGLAGQPPAGVGFNLGVRFNLRMIIP